MRRTAAAAFIAVLAEHPGAASTILSRLPTKRVHEIQTAAERLSTLAWQIKAGRAEARGVLR